MKPLTPVSVVNELVKKHGSLSAAGRAVKLAAPVLCRIRSGQAGRLSDKTLAKLKLRRVPEQFVRSR